MTEECTCGKCKPKSKIPELSKYFIGGLAGVLLASFLAHGSVTKKLYPAGDINEDGIEDMIGETDFGKKIVFYGVKIGDKIEYKLPEDIENWGYDRTPPVQ